MASRRQFLETVGASAAAIVAAARAHAQTPSQPPAAPPPRDFGPSALPAPYPDPDLLVVDPEFGALRLGNTPIKRLWTGALWAEGPAWSSEGRYLVWSDVAGNRQYRWIEDDERVAVFRSPSNNSNGNTFDFHGRQISCEHLTRRVVRYEHDGSVTTLAESVNGKRLNSPNDVVPHPDGSYWFTDPPYGRSLYEGRPEPRELPTAVYRIDKSGAIAQVIGEDQVPDPNGLAFSPDYKTLYVVSTGRGPGDSGPGGKGDVFVLDVNNDKAANARRFADFMVDGVKCSPDGIRCDVTGHVWCSSNAGRSAGYNGVTVWTPQAKLIGRIRLPEACANLCFGGPKRNRLFMTASQSLYAVYVNTQGAAPG
ncbi:MAG TPA: SMP-30/gluconolactonase/LRE family protein [Vicinamibacterales bacterium]|nr:SMP-30/gluconolactonase/LRE family protein [Vicinamibacterales bacterium]